MSGEEIDSAASWFASILRSMGFDPTVKIEEKGARDSAREWLKEPVYGVKLSDDERLLQWYEERLLSFPGNKSILEKIAKLKNKLGRWD